MLIQTFALFAAALGVAAKPLGRPVVTDTHLFAYGKGISGLPIVRVKGMSPLANNTPLGQGQNLTTANLDGAYLMGNESTAVMPPVQNVTFSCTTENRTLQSSTEGQSGQNATQANLFGFNKETGLAVFTDLGDAAVSTQGFIFFGSMLFVDVSKKMEAAWTARRVQVEGQSMFEVSWNSTAEDALPIQLNTRAPMHQ
ncbi:hypothetical protein PG985_014381 [Apiospora marii]|uniref:uncharacterized protein n=1 Tax=Apiospora marii TaxID=335849 RepID=UPI0031307FB1